MVKNLIRLKIRQSGFHLDKIVVRNYDESETGTGLKNLEELIMILSASQPYFAPFPGFFYKALLSDVFVIMDDVQFPRGTTWITRNRFKNDQGTLWMTIPVQKKGLGLQKINEVRIDSDGRWAKKHTASLEHAYGKSPYWRDHRDYITDLFLGGIEKLIDLNLNIIHYLADLVQMDTKIVRLSDLDIKAVGNRRLVKICRQLGADIFLAQRPAGKYLNADLFEKAGIKIDYVNPPSPVYPQLWGDFIPNLSTFDLIFNCGPKAMEILMPDSGF